MTRLFDHYEAAFSYLEGMDFDTYSMTNEHKEALALIHAQLETAKQARIANLIALHEWTDREGDLPDTSTDLIVEIGKGLGMDL